MNELTHENQKEYIKKNFEFGIFAGMQSAMSKKGHHLTLAEKILE